MSNGTIETAAKVPPSVSLTISEVDIVKMILEFLDTRGLHIAQLSLERETGIINGGFSDDVLFLRQLILDGQWDSALDFVEPLKELPEFDFGVFRYFITKYKYFELLCLNQEPGIMHDNDFTVQELVECLKDLERLCPTPEDFRSLCALLTLPKLSEHVDFKNWNPSSARIECFRKIEPMVTQLLPPMKRSTDSVKLHSVNDRLVQLLVKGAFYEGCVDFCQAQAIGDVQAITARPSQILACRPRLCNNDLSLVNWLEAMDKSQYVLPFKQKSLDLKTEKIKKPKLEAQWTEHILATPVKPGGVFPHSLVPTTKLKCAQQMSQSMVLPAMATSFSVALAHDTRKKMHRMSQSTAPMVGFSIEGSKDHGEAMMAQSQMIDAMFETSQYTKSTRPSNLHVSFGPTSQPTANELSQSRYPAPPIQNSNVYRPPMMTSMVLDKTVRRQLEDMARTAQRHLTLPTVPELNTPGEELTPEVAISSVNSMTTSKLYKEFSNKQIQDSAYGQPTPVQFRQQHADIIPRPQTAPTISQPYSTSQAIEEPLKSTMRQPKRYYRMASQPLPHQSNELPTNSAYDMASVTAVLPDISETPSTSECTVQFVPVCKYEDKQAIRAVAFHPSGRYFALGTNSKQMLICRYPYAESRKSKNTPQNIDVLLKRPKQHRGSVYCIGFNPNGELLATGSNDKTMRLMSFNTEHCKIGAEMELTVHDGTVRDIIFMEDTAHRTVLVSGGAGNCRIHLTDCSTGKTFNTHQGHTAAILGLYTWGSASFVSCSQDKTVRFWDLRTAQAIHVVAPSSKISNAPVTSVCVDPNGKLLVTGHEDASIMLYDISGRRIVQVFRPHGDEVRTVRFSNAAYYLLSGSYDKRIVFTDMRGDLTAPLLYLPVAEHNDKIIQCRWHPQDFSFLSTSADRSAVLWSLPPPSSHI